LRKGAVVGTDNNGIAPDRSKLDSDTRF